ncbi:MAG: transglycosylase SLT domain-containing protein [Alphaproteobacteria bacterium]|nr:transglycosylase SLT domain-containing protein [Alphaproteobacteria bacterium]
MNAKKPDTALNPALEADKLLPPENEGERLSGAFARHTAQSKPKNGPEEDGRFVFMAASGMFGNILHEADQKGIEAPERGASSSFSQATGQYHRSSEIVTASYSGSEYGYSAGVEKLLKAGNPKVVGYIETAVQAAQARGLNPQLFVNQLYAESGYREDVVTGQRLSSTGARGVGQLMPETGARYGLHSPADFANPEKSINAAAEYMKDLTNRYGSQELAIVAYNGGGGAINLAKEGLGESNITIDQWNQFMAERRISSPSAKASAWQNETYTYVNKILVPPSDSTENQDVAALNNEGNGVKVAAAVSPPPAPA